MKKNFNSKNLSNQIRSLILLGKADLALEILKAEELKAILPNIISLLERKKKKQDDFNKTKIYSKTDIDKLILKKLTNILQISDAEIQNSEVVVDEHMSAGVKVKSKDVLIDATLDTMLQNAIDKILKNN